jgi:hypothetical protein
MSWFENHYKCPRCKHEWTDEWDCMCNDRCPFCNIECTPLYSKEVENNKDLSNILTDLPHDQLVEVRRAMKLDLGDWSEMSLFEGSRSAIFIYKNIRYRIEEYFETITGIFYDK